MNSAANNRENAVDLFAGPGEVRSHARQLDWSATPLGATSGWSPALRTMVRSIFDSPVPICLWSGPQYALIYNDAYRHILAAKHPASLGQPGSIVWAEIWEELQPQFDGVWTGGKPVQFEDAPFVMARLEGGGTETAWFNYSLSALRDEDASVVAVLNITPETTDRVLLARRLAEEQIALAASEAAAKLDAQRVQLALAAGAIVGTWFWDIPANRFTADEPFANAFGMDPASAKAGVPLVDIFATVHPDDQAGLAQAIEAAMSRGGAYSHQYRVRRSDGQYHWIEANGRVDHEPDGTPLSFPGVLIDIERRRAVEEERDRAIAALVALNETLEQRVEERSGELMRTEDALRQSQKMEAIGQLTGGIAHDFNNMLATITSSLELMSRRIASGKGGDMTRYLTMASTAAQSAAALIKRLLAFSRKQTLDLQAVEVNGLIAQMEDMLQRSTGENVQFALSLQPSLPTVRSDRNQLENALLNLTINARDAMPTGGTIQIATTTRELDAGYAAMHPEVAAGQYVVVSVSDNGTGMSPEVIAKAFDPFFTTKPIGQGTGLGLSMIYGFARQTQGHASIHSIVGEGTTVNIYLPCNLDSVKASATRVQSVARSPQGQGETVLFVEDEPGVRLVLAEILGELGYEAYEAIDAPNAMAVAQTLEKIDLLITDVGLPGTNGRQLAEMVRVHRPDLKVLFITGYATNAAVKGEFLGRGMDMLAKPFTIDALAHKVQDMLAEPAFDKFSTGLEGSDSAFGNLTS